MKRAFILSAVVLWLACASNVFGSITLTYQWSPHQILEGETSKISLSLAFGSGDKNPKKIENGLIEGDKTGITLPYLLSDPSKSSLAFSASNVDPYSVDATFRYLHPGTAIPRISGTASWKDGSNKTKTGIFGAELSVVVGQVNPTITLDSVVAVDENELFALHVSATDPGVAVHNFTYAWDLDNDHLFDDATGASAQHSFPHFGVFEVGVRVDDGEGGASEGKLKVTVLEPEPTPPTQGGDVPEPASVVIWGVGGLCAAAAACRRRKGKQQPRWSEETRSAIFAVVHARPE